MNISALSTNLPSLWTAMETPLVNHLWQSTLFAAGAGLLTLAVRTNRAQVRFWLWFAASIKFLIPFSLLVWMGSHLRWAKPAPASGFLFIIEQIGQPFTPAQPSHAAAPVISHLLPEFLLMAWVCGCLGVLCFWGLRWRRVTKAIHGAVPTSSGREFEMLRRLEQSAGMPGRVRLIVSKSAMEPGLLGIIRPILLLPSGVAEQLSDAQLEAIITHELCHFRRRDNLAAAIHMLVEALFWFHPLVWWMGSRLINERERACDEAVLHLGNEPQVYAEGILKVCEFYLESPLVCVAGITGSNLKRRIEAIMIHRITSKLNFGKKLVLAVAAFSVLAIPIGVGLLHPTKSAAQAQAAPAVFEFTSVSLKPKGTAKGVISTRLLEHKGQFEAENQSLKGLIAYAYHISDFQISGGPAWISSELYDLDVKGKPTASGEELRQTVQKVLADRFKLAIHRELKEQPIYELAVGANGSKLAQAADEVKPRMVIQPIGQLIGKASRISYLVDFLQTQTGRTVIDKTGLTGFYDFTLDVSSLAGSPKSPEALAAIANKVSEQLGLELKPQTGLVDTLVIDHAEKVTTNE
ncbi:MAG TPA: M56 family metallopeptidase [Candidatus Angelobacter sp.]|nr:M56 family metallopeptidase [Candidatus Angelobacter sp.]